MWIFQPAKVLLYFINNYNKRSHIFQSSSYQIWKPYEELPKTELKLQNAVARSCDSDNNYTLVHDNWSTVNTNNSAWISK
jgi:hypothetical protein